MLDPVHMSGDDDVMIYHGGCGLDSCGLWYDIRGVESVSMTWLKVSHKEDEDTCRGHALPLQAFHNSVSNVGRGGASLTLWGTCSRSCTAKPAVMS